VIIVCLILILSFFALIPMAYCTHTGVNGKDELPDIDIQIPDWVKAASLGTAIVLEWVIEWIINEIPEALFDIIIYYPLNGIKWIFDSITYALTRLGLASPFATSIAMSIILVLGLAIIILVVRILDIVL